MKHGDKAGRNLSAVCLNPAGMGGTMLQPVPHSQHELWAQLEQGGEATAGVGKEWWDKNYIQLILYYI